MGLFDARKILLFGGGNNPVLDANFLTGGTVTNGSVSIGPNSPKLTFTRATNAWYFNSSGLLVVASAGFARLDYGINGTSSLGLLVEQAATNVVLWNRDLTNAVWTLGATMTSAKDQTGIDGVLNSASSITGGAVSATNTILQTTTFVIAAAFQTAYVKRLIGSGVVNMTLDGGVTWTAITVTAAWTRVSIPTQTLANPVVGFQIITSGDSIAVDCVQNEAGIFATSPIVTTTVAVTRNADQPTMATSGISGWKGDGNSIIAQGMLPSTYSSPGTNTDNTIFFGTAATVGLAFGLGLINNDYEASSTLKFSALHTGGTTVTGVPIRLGFSYISGAQFLVQNKTSASGTSTYTPGTETTLHIGYQNNIRYFNGWVQRIRVWNRVLPNSAIQSLTQPGSN